MDLASGTEHRPVACAPRNKKRQNAEMYELAINEWERDLTYLKKTYYDGHYDAGSKFFPWPNASTSADR